ncbi:1-aminocyclopropane-1-carboxylate deaminase/D-cysteine desulfhydrase [Catellatospora tritici]|uniref:1-aminocyclopropane-1-carboxylate deaminase/D-cysteine desulfhydrase n=1 Tax=Catellatospora tritici TaxID=2851566 RepID=UPI001C2D589D|nr:pyridoxal-phosphate dependent enzyme [Catellatospora tritici]MBV1855368.1 pyridoxal-phosphate dependent enzyme [Catellatospora tritici]
MRLDVVRDERLADHGVALWLCRDDLTDPELPGNKLRKLKYNLVAAREHGHRTLLTFGGAYSNHLRAVAAAGRRHGFATVGVVRGEPYQPLNPSLAYATAQGMRLTYLDRDTYRRKHTEPVLTALREQFGDCYVLPEGGSNALAVRGCAELPAELDFEYDLLCCPVGTGGTLAGLAGGLPPGATALGFAVLKGAAFLADEVTRLQTDTWGAPTTNWRLDLDHHFGGYAKTPPDLLAFCEDFTQRHGYRPDPIYTGKMLAGLYARIASGTIPAGTRIAAVTTA